MNHRFIVWIHPTTLHVITRSVEVIRLKSSDSAAVLQYGSGPLSDFLAKILGVDTPLFLVLHNFIFHFVGCLSISNKSRRICVVSVNSDGSVFAYDAGGWDSISRKVIFLITLSIMTFMF
jgi:hypothetical protein